MLGAPALDLQPQGQQGFAAEVRHDLKAREPPSIRRAHACFAASGLIHFTGRPARVTASLFHSRTLIKG